MKGHATLMSSASDDWATPPVSAPGRWHHCRCGTRWRAIGRYVRRTTRGYRCPGCELAALVAKNTTRPDYYTYIASPAWREKATAAKARAGHKCQVCNANDRTLDAHHRTYERLGHELATDITVLCRPCHELFETQRKTKGMAS